MRLQDVVSGATANVHVTVTDFTPGRGHVIKERDGRWDTVWVPLLPAGEAQAPTVGLVLRSFRVRDKAALDELYARTRHSGILTQGVDRDVTEVLRRHHPGIQGATVRVLAEGRTPPTRRQVQLSWIGGSAMVCAALFCGVRAYRRGEHV